MTYASDPLLEPPCSPILNPTQPQARKLPSMHSLHRYLLGAPLARRVALPAALAMLAVGVVHLIDGSSSLHDNFAIGALELALTAAVVPLAVLLATRPVRLFWHLAGALCTAALLTYVLSRTTGLPGSSDDIGNWLQTLGVLNVAFELMVIVSAAYVVRMRSAAGATSVDTVASPAEARSLAKAGTGSLFAPRAANVAGVLSGD